MGQAYRVPAKAGPSLPILIRALHKDELLFSNSYEYSACPALRPIHLGWIFASSIKELTFGQCMPDKSQTKNSCLECFDGGGPPPCQYIDLPRWAVVLQHQIGADHLLVTGLNGQTMYQALDCSPLISSILPEGVASIYWRTHLGIYIFRSLFFRWLMKGSLGSLAWILKWLVTAVWTAVAFLMALGTCELPLFFFFLFFSWH